MGAQGIAVPHVNTADEARAVVDAAKFGPIGHRGSATSRQGIGVADYFAKANDETMIVILIEDIVAIQNLDSILEVDHIDVFFIAPGDLAQSMGHAGEYSHPDVTAAVEDSIRRIVASGRVAGDAGERVQRGPLREAWRPLLLGELDTLDAGGRSEVPGHGGRRRAVALEEWR